MPRRRKLPKLTKEEQKKNKDCVVKCTRSFKAPRLKLVACPHRTRRSELFISPLQLCLLCIWEDADTDTEYDPALAEAEYDSDFYGDNDNQNQ